MFPSDAFEANKASSTVIEIPFTPLNEFSWKASFLVLRSQILIVLSVLPEIRYSESLENLIFYISILCPQNSETIVSDFKLLMSISLIE